MRIGIDARILGYSRAGISRYARGLIGALEKNRNGFDFFLLRSWRDGQTSVVPNFQSRTLFTPPHSRLEKFFLPLELRFSHLDLVHAIDFFCAVPKKLPLIATVHDLYFLRDPSVMDGASRKHYGQVHTFLPRAAHILCDSQSTFHDLEHFFPDAAKKASVVYPGIDWKRFTERQNLEDSEEKIFLFVGTLEPRKNILRLLEAYHRLRTRLGNEVPDFYFAGTLGHESEKIKEKIQTLDLGRRVHLLGAVNEDQLKNLYSRASALLYASLGEGFGFPLLEAMAFGVPIITSRNSSLVEVAGDAALLVDPLSVESIASAMEHVLVNQTLAENLRRSGHSRVQSFSWDTMVTKVLQVYEHVLGRI